MHVQNKYSWIKHVDFIGLNLVALVCAFIVSFYLTFGSMDKFFRSNWRDLLVILCLISVVTTLVINPYSSILRRPYYIDAFKLFLLTVYTFVVVAIFFYLLRIGDMYSRSMLLLTFILYYCFSLLLLCIRKSLILSGKIQVFNVRARQIVAVIRRYEVYELVNSVELSGIKEYNVAGFCFPCDECDETDIDGVPVIQKDDLVAHVLSNHIDDIYVSVEPASFDADSYKALVDNGVNIHIGIKALIGIQTDDQLISRVGSFTTLSIGPYAMDSDQAFYLIVKRGLDIIIGLIGCIFLIPLTILVKVVSLVNGDTASIFYTQKRVGRFGKVFNLYKFRSMVPDADKMLAELMKNDEYREQWEKNQKIDDDPRITSIGKLLRRASLDEFPQFINILKGDMSLVGPRPLVPGELEAHNGLTLYNKVKPGITGWWACNGRSNINYRERLDLEYYYVKNCSLHLDIIIIFRTAVSVLRREGAQ